jgi:hypothetical protein
MSVSISVGDVCKWGMRNEKWRGNPAKRRARYRVNKICTLKREEKKGSYFLSKGYKSRRRARK